jgi:hypothetical protein
MASLRELKTLGLYTAASAGIPASTCNKERNNSYTKLTAPKHEGNYSYELSLFFFGWWVQILTFFMERYLAHQYNMYSFTYVANYVRNTFARRAVRSGIAGGCISRTTKGCTVNAHEKPQTC